jgi:hypothetical protein
MVLRNPPGSIRSASGMFTKMQPKPIGTSRRGSKSFLIPRKRRIPPMTIMMMLGMER